MKTIEYFLPCEPSSGLKIIQSCYGDRLRLMGREGALYTIMLIAGALLRGEDVATAQQSLIKIAEGRFPPHLDFILENLEKSSKQELEGLMMAIATLLAQGVYTESVEGNVRDLFPQQFAKEHGQNNPSLSHLSPDRPTGSVRR